MFVEKTVRSLHPGGFHSIVYSEFPGDPAKTVVCVHGLARNGRDFDWLAKALAEQGYRVICPDLPGRGRSPAFENPAWYNYPQYMADIVALLAAIDAPAIDWVGTSMGGLLGMMIANQQGHPIKRMVINDIGPFIPAAALQRIKAYVTLNPSYSTRDSYISAFRKRHALFGLETDEQWDYLINTSTIQDEKGHFLMNYDTKVALGLESSGHITDLNLWALWPRVDMPILILRGAQSDVLLAETMDQMMVGKQARAHVFQNVGHAPALMNNEQIKVVTEWISSNR